MESSEDFGCEERRETQTGTEVVGEYGEDKEDKMQREYQDEHKNETCPY